MSQQIVDVDSSKSIAVTAQQLNLKPNALIVLLGSVDASTGAALRSLCARAIGPTAYHLGALIIDDARVSGFAALMAEGALELDHAPSMLGVVPSAMDAKEIDTQHETVLRLPGTWPDYLKSLFELAGQIAEDGDIPRPVMAILAGGGDTEKKAIVRCARRGWPVLVVKGTGGVADSIASAIAPATSNTVSVATDPDLQEIVETARVLPSSVDTGIEDVRRILVATLDTSTSSLGIALNDAWARYNELDGAAVQKQRQFRAIELSLILLAVFAALFAILSSGQAITPAFRASVHGWGLPVGSLHFLLLLTPILITILGAYNGHFRPGSKWVLLRGSAEAVKREIFRYRASAGDYSDEQCMRNSREAKLASKINDIISTLEQSEVNKTSWRLEPVQRQDGLKCLTPSEYVHARIQDQINYLERKIRSLYWELSVLQVGVYLAGGAGTLLAAYKRDIWVALATACSTALITKLQTEQVENSLIQYNQTLSSLKNVLAWWNALSSWEKERQRNIDLLVDRTEKSLESETLGWVQQMQSELDKLTEKEPSKQ
jgi:hypothetical protein